MDDLKESDMSYILSQLEGEVPFPAIYIFYKVGVFAQQSATQHPGLGARAWKDVPARISRYRAVQAGYTNLDQHLLKLTPSQMEAEARKYFDSF